MHLAQTWRRIAGTAEPESAGDRALAGLLQAASGIYKLAAGLRNTAYDRGWLPAHKAPCAVISVGNISVGGTGKTPCVEMVARLLEDRKLRAAVLSRGYGARIGNYWLRRSGEGWDSGGSLADIARAADEPRLLAGRLTGVPVVVDPDRLRGARLAREQFAVDAVILDDGFQHRRLARDLDIVLIPSRMPLQQGALLPRGPLREPAESLRRADLVMLTKADEYPESAQAMTEWLRGCYPHQGVVWARHKPCSLWCVAADEMLPVESLSGRRVGLVSSIGDPVGFESTVRGIPSSVRWHLAFPDHHAFGPRDWDLIRRHCIERKVDVLLTTEKDWMRLERCIPPEETQVWNLQVLRVELELTHNAQVLHDRLDRLFLG